MLAVRAAGLTGTETVYDVCAAPGGKSFYAAQLLAMTQASSESLSDQPAGLNLSEDAGKASGTDHSGPEYGGRVLSFDLTKRKTDRIREGAVRLHLTNITVKERDARLDQPGVAQTSCSAISPARDSVSSGKSGTSNTGPAGRESFPCRPCSVRS